MRVLTSASALVLIAWAAPGCAPADAARTESRALIANRNLDVLFMIDDSASMQVSQANLVRDFPSFTNVLQALPGGLPNIHVAVVSSDMGAGDGTVPLCTATGDAGRFQTTPRGTCTSSTLKPGATFIASIDGVTNYTAPDIATVFQCIAALGQDGCGFESPFASVLRALGADGNPPPSGNVGFLRGDALLAIVMLASEDDCSTRAGTPLGFFDNNSDLLLTSEFGPASGYRCNEYGHVCGGARPPRLAPHGQVGDSVTLQSCASSECDGLLTPVAEVAARIKSLKIAPASEILVAAITGPATPYTVTWQAPGTPDTSCGAATCPWPRIEHSCTAADGSSADPAVRIRDLISAFGANGFLSSICDADFAPALQQIAGRIGSLLLAGGGSGSPPGGVPRCAVTGIGGEGASAGDATGAGGSSGGGSGSDAAAGGGPPDNTGCGCCAAGARGTPVGLGLALAVSAWRARRRRGRASLARGRR